MVDIKPDQQTAYECVPDQARVGRFSEGLEQLAPSVDKLHRGRFSVGQERIDVTRRRRRTRRFSEGLERLPERPSTVRRGSFADTSPRPRPAQPAQPA